MVVIPASQFRMGCVSGKACQEDELPVRTVSFDKPFAIGKHEVTFAEYDRFAEATGAQKPKDRGWGRGLRPVIKVSWDNAVAYAKWLSEQTGKRYRLPSEAEWEYATRAGTTTPFSTGECIDTDQANYNGDYDWSDCPKTGVYREQTLQAGSLSANPWKLHEVHGNVWEWVQDCSLRWCCKAVCLSQISSASSLLSNALLSWCPVKGSSLIIASRAVVFEGRRQLVVRRRGLSSARSTGNREYHARA